MVIDEIEVPSTGKVGSPVTIKVRGFLGDHDTVNSVSILVNEETKSLKLDATTKKLGGVQNAVPGFPTIATAFTPRSAGIYKLSVLVTHTFKRGLISGDQYKPEFKVFEINVEE